MAEEKKAKIDLKARLGKTQVGVAPPAAAPSGVPAPGSVPAPGPLPAPGPGLPPAAGIAPPFAQPAPAAPAAPAAPPAPKVDASDPFAAVAVAPTRVAPAEIKIEIGEDAIAAQAAAGRRTTMIGTISLAVGLLLGYALGDRMAQSAAAKTAVNGAHDLVEEIEKSQVKIKELNEKLAAAVKSLGEKKFPDAFSNELGGISIPFGADKLAGKNIGRFDPRTTRLLVAYAGDVEQLNSRKDALRNLFAGQKEAISGALAQAENPKVNFGVFVQKSQAHGPVAVLAPIPAGQSFAYKDANWPAKFKVSTGKELVDVERYASGDVVSNPPKVVVVPIDPDSVAGSFPNDVVVKLTSELRKTIEVLAGRTGGTPDEEEAGVIKEGDRLLTELKKIGGK